MSAYRDTGRLKSFTRRVALLGGAQLLLFGVLAGRMYQLQVVESKKYKTLSDENRINLRLLPPPRGRILDRYGRPLAINEENYRVTLVAEQVDDVNALLDHLSHIITLGDHDRQRILREIKRRRGFVPVTVRENLDWTEVSRIEVNAPDLPGLSIEVGQSRNYPYAEDFSHILGYVAAVSERDMGDDPLLELPGFKIGKNGIERVYDRQLRGKAGNSQVEVNAVGRVIRELSRDDGQPGQDVTLTVDRDIQIFAAERLRKEKSASAVVLDVETGDVIAAASMPGFDPNQFVTGLSTKTWRSLVDDPYAPLIDKAVAGLYAPGSTFKVAVALAAQEAGIPPDHRVFCRGYMELGNARFHCWKHYGHGWLDMVGGIKHSCDVYFYDIAKRIGIDRIAAMANRLGLGHKTGIQLPNEKAGVIPTRAWKRANFGTPWQQGETLIAGIGQGFVLTTPMQLAVMTARIANGKKAISPTLVRDVGSEKEPDGAHGAKDLGIKKEWLDTVREGMYEVTNDLHGTAHRARITIPGMEMSGKTGTAQVRRISRAERETGVLKNEQRPWRERDHALFIGFAPSQHPRYCTAVVVEHGGGGSAVAAPIARDLLIETQKRDPSGTTTPPADKGPTAEAARKSEEG